MGVRSCKNTYLSSSGVGWFHIADCVMGVCPFDAVERLYGSTLHGTSPQSFLSSFTSFMPSNKRPPHENEEPGAV